MSGLQMCRPQIIVRFITRVTWRGTFSLSQERRRKLYSVRVRRKKTDSFPKRFHCCDNHSIYLNNLSKYLKSDTQAEKTEVPNSESLTVAQVKQSLDIKVDKKNVSSIHMIVARNINAILYIE